MRDTFSKPYECQVDASSDPKELERLQFHLKTGDYFPLLATVMCALEEGIKSCEAGVEHAAEYLDSTVLENIRKELLYLHKHYTITPKSD